LGIAPIEKLLLQVFAICEDFLSGFLNASNWNRRDQRAVCFAPRAESRPFRPSDPARSASQSVRSSRAAFALTARAAGFRLRLGGGRYAPLHFSRSPTADRSQMHKCINVTQLADKTDKK